MGCGISNTPRAHRLEGWQCRQSAPAVFAWGCPMVTSSPVVIPAVPRSLWKDRFGPAVISGFVATTAMAIAALIAYGIALGLGNAGGNLFQQWLFALTHNPVTENVRSSLLAVVGLDLAAGIVWALVFAWDANDRLLAFPGWLRGVLFALPPAILSLVVFLPLVGGGIFGIEIGAGPLPVIGNIVLHLIYGAVLGGMFALDGSIGHVGAGDPAIEATLRQAEAGAGWGVLLGALVGGGGTLLVSLLVAAHTAANIAGATIGGAVVGAALGVVFGSMIAMTNEPSRAPVAKYSSDGGSTPIATT